MVGREGADRTPAVRPSAACSVLVFRARLQVIRRHLVVRERSRFIRASVAAFHQRLHDFRRSGEGHRLLFGEASSRSFGSLDDLNNGPRDVRPGIPVKRDAGFRIPVKGHIQQSRRTRRRSTSRCKAPDDRTRKRHMVCGSPDKLLRNGNRICFALGKIRVVNR